MIKAGRVARNFIALNNLPTKEEAVKLLKSEGINLDGPVFKKIKGLIQKLLKGKQAGISDILQKIQKLTGIDFAIIAAVAALVMSSPAHGEDFSSPINLEQSDISKAKKDVLDNFELPKGLVTIIKKTPQFLLNQMGISGFRKTLTKEIKKTITPEIQEALSKIPPDKWKDILSTAVMKKIKSDEELSKKFQVFMQDQKLTEVAMLNEIKGVVDTSHTEIQKEISLAMGDIPRGHPGA